MDALLTALRSIGEPTRLRAVAALRTTELTVTELCRVLSQSQPRVSRHLKLLCDAGVLERHAQGTSAYYRLATGGLGRALADAIDPLIDESDQNLVRDARRVASIRAERAAGAAAYFESIAGDWDRIRTSHVSDEAVEQAMLDAVLNQPVGDLLDIGTGTGRILELFADHCDTGLGIDLSAEMLNLARSRIEERGMRHCKVRHGNGYDTKLDAGSFDTAVLHHVLHFLEDPGAAIEEAARTIRPGGRLLIVDFAPHDWAQLSTEYAHRHLGFADETVAGWCDDAGFSDLTSTHLAPPDGTDEKLVVSLWVATQNSNAPATYRLDVAS